jgi:hypothetical protein
VARTRACPSGSLVYLSGYQLASASGERLVCWLERQPQVSAFIDFGPRIADIPETLMARLMALKPLVSVNARKPPSRPKRTDFARGQRIWRRLAEEHAAPADCASG